MSYIIEAEGLRKRFGNTQALDGVDLAAREGTVLGVLGPNGAGKTTAVRILATLLRADAGTRPRRRLRRRQATPAQVRRTIGLTGQYASVDEDLTGTQNLVHDRPAARPAAPATPRPAPPSCSSGSTWPTPPAGVAKTYSGGMRRRLDLAASLVGRPAVIFLDEPTTGLDPAKREDMWDVVRRLVADGSTVLLTTQYLEEADALADEITVIDHGRVIAHDTPDGLKRDRRRPAHPGPPGRPGPARTTSAAILAEIAGNDPQPTGRGRAHRRRSTTTTALRRRPSAGCAAEGIAVTELSLHLPSLDEVFLTLTGHGSPTTPTTTRRTQHDHHHRTHAQRGRARRPAGRRRHADRHRRGATCGTSSSLAKRSLIKMWRTPEALIDVTLQPIIFLLLFTYIFGGAIAGGSQQDYLQFLLPGMLGQTHRDGRRRARAEPQRRHREGRLRPVPLAADRPVGAAGRRGARRRRPLPDPVRRHPRLRLHHGLPDRDQPAGRRSPAIGISHRLRAVLLLDLGVRRHDGPDLRARCRAIMFLIVLPLTFASNTFVAHVDDARLAADLRQGQPDLPPGRHRARADDRRPGRRPA